MKTQNAVEIKELFVSYYGTSALEAISLKVPIKQIVGIIGPNGAGKSTLIKAIMGLIPIDKGNIKVMGQPVSKYFKRIAYVPQHKDIDQSFPVTVYDVLMMGRYPYIPFLKRPELKDHKIVKDCLEKVGVLNVKDKQIGELSGGQRQRVFLARALAQTSDILLLDEPFAGIDITSENIIIQLLKKLRDKGKTIMVVHHDLSKAGDFFDSLILLNKQLIKFGKSEEVYKVDYLNKAYEANIAAY